RLLAKYRSTLAPDTPPSLRATFRLALYADLRLRFAARFDLAQYADEVRGSNPESAQALQRAFQAQLAAANALHYDDPDDTYNLITQSPALARTRWATQALLQALTTVRGQERSDPDLNQSHDLLGPDLQAVRAQTVTLLLSDVAVP